MADLKLIAERCIPEECKDDLVSRREVYRLKLMSVTDWDFGQALINLPPAEPEIIRRKDCRYYYNTNPENIPTKNDSESHIRTIKDLISIFEPYLTVEDIQEIIEDLEDMRGDEDDA